MCMVGDDDYWDFYTEYSPTARKDHRCGECGRVIRKGEKYWTQGGLNDGSFSWHKTCVHCNAASDWLVKVCAGWIFNAREEDFLSHVVGGEKDIRSRPLVRLVRWMRADWVDRDGVLRPLEEVEAVTAEAVAAYRRQYGQAVA